MADPFATVADLQAGWRLLTADEQARATVLLARASRKIRARKPGIDNLIAAGTLDGDLVGDIVCAMVKRAMPTADDGLGDITQRSETKGPFTESFTFANPSGDLYLTKAEKTDLGISGRQRAGSVDLLAMADELDDSSSSSSSSSSS